jgi:hypothetical protein
MGRPPGHGYKSAEAIGVGLIESSHLAALQLADREVDFTLLPSL